jgi:hypothetical protein
MQGHAMSDAAEEDVGREANLLDLLGQMFTLATGRSNPPDDLPLKPDGTVDAMAWFKQIEDR